MDRETIGREVGMALGERNILVTFHPVTVEAGSLGRLRSMNCSPRFRRARSGVPPVLHAGQRGRRRPRAERAHQGVRRGPANAIAVASLGQLRYISLMNQVDVVVGNSSSGVYEAPSLNAPSVDIGDRQKGRERAASVFHAAPERQAISAAIAQALRRGRQPTVSPYGDGEASRRIADGIAAIADFRALLQKGFHDIAHGGAREMTAAARSSSRKPASIIPAASRPRWPSSTRPRMPAPTS